MFRKSFPFAFLIAALVIMAAVAVPVRAQASFYEASLDGSQEVPSVDSDAFGYGIFAVKGQKGLTFSLHVANIEDVFAAHIHCAPAGANGPVGVTLFGGETVSFEKGALARGTITAPDKENGCGWTNLGDVLGAIENGGAYVNVHTLASPSGEIRGQIH